MQLQIEGHLASDQLVHVQQVVDQVGQALAVLVGDVEHLSHGFGDFAHHAAFDQAQRAGDRGQRRAQFMADGGHELALHRLDAFAFGDVVHHHDGADQLAFRRQ